MTLDGVEAVEAEMAKRALAEVVGHYVLGAGHGLFNLAARTVALDQTLKGDLRIKLGTDFPPLSEQRKDSPQAAKAATLQDVAQLGYTRDPERGGPHRRPGDIGRVEASQRRSWF